MSLLPFLTGENAAPPYKTLFWRMFANQRAVRHGDLKLVWSGPAEQGGLYDVVNDPGESRNLAKDRPEDVKKLQALYDAWNAELAEPKWKPAPPIKLNPNQLTPQQRAALPQPGQEKAWFDRLDKNRDGKLLSQEFPRPRLFQMMDTNRDGALTFDEMIKFLKMIRKL